MDMVTVFVAERVSGMTHHAPIAKIATNHGPNGKMTHTSKITAIIAENLDKHRCPALCAVLVIFNQCRCSQHRLSR